jgi:hypothetical protein
MTVPFLTAAQVRSINNWAKTNPDDCREYDVEDIARRFHIEPAQAQLVFDGIQKDIPISHPIARFEEWIKDKDPTLIGRLLKEYIAESNHGSWEGFESREITTIAKLLADMYLYYEETDEDHFRETSSVNPL